MASHSQAGSPGTDGLSSLAAVARPGDTVLVGLSIRMSDEEFIELRESFVNFTETTGVHIAIIENVSSLVVLRGPEEEEYRDAGAG